MNLLKIATYLPLILKIVKRARVLATATQSQTTKAQWEVAFPVAVAVAALGVFFPDLANDAVAQGVIVAVIALISPLVARLMLYRADVPISSELLTRAIVAARRDGAGYAWEEATGTVLDAQAEGYDLAVLEDGGIVEVDTGAVIGEIARRKNTDEEARAVVRRWVEKIKEDSKK